MTMIAQRLTDFSQIEMLYHFRMKKDFPPDELKPLDAIRRLWTKQAYECFGLFNGNRILGYAFFLRSGGNFLFDYFAIAEERRDEGLGSLFIRQLSDFAKEADCIIVEVEDAAKARDEEAGRQRERRLQFYLRNGFRETQLTATVFGVDFTILEFPAGGEHTDEEVCRIYTELYRSSLPGQLFRTQFEVR